MSDNKKIVEAKLYQSGRKILVQLSNEEVAESKTYNKALVIMYKDKNGKIIALDIEYEWTKDNPC